MEDYYLDGPEADGEWLGAGGPLLGLRGRVDGEALHRVLAGDHPASGLALSRHGGARVPGFDVTLSAHLEARAIDVRLGDRHVQLDAAYLGRTSDRSGPALAHGYAITGHSAQGLTCDEAFVLVGDGASREWAYTALSRGRRSNWLYAVEHDLDERAEYAPADSRRPGHDVVRRALARSAAQRLASEHEREAER